MEIGRMKKQISFPPAWLGEVRAAYDCYRIEWENEEAERERESGEPAEKPQGWDDFLIEYHYAELAACVGVGDPRDCE
jgi:hypothetical protein